MKDCKSESQTLKWSQDEKGYKSAHDLGFTYDAYPTGKLVIYWQRDDASVCQIESPYFDQQAADETYYMKEKIVRWMPFPDSQYVAPEEDVHEPSWPHGGGQPSTPAVASHNLGYNKSGMN